VVHPVLARVMMRAVAVVRSTGASRWWGVAECYDVGSVGCYGVSVSEGDRQPHLHAEDV
jgi:hypothetical protein